jgi:hypothetical protein
MNKELLELRWGLTIDQKWSHYMPWRRLGGGEVWLLLILDFGTRCPGRALASGKGPQVAIGQEAGLAPDAVWTQRLKEKSSARDRTPYRPVVQFVVRHYTD